MAASPISRRTRMIVAAGFCIALGTTAVTAFAEIPNTSTGEIESCYQTKDGSLRVVDTQAGGTCRKGETPLAWDQHGQPGPQGPAGPAGPQGPQGIPGPVAAGPDVYYATTVAPFDHFSLTREPHDTGDSRVLLSKNVPAGAYVIEARAAFQTFERSDPDSLAGRTMGTHCSIPGHRGEVDLARQHGDGNTTGGTPALQVEFTSAVNHPGGPIEFTCELVFPTLVAETPTMLVTRVGSVN